MKISTMQILVTAILSSSVPANALFLNRDVLSETNALPQHDPTKTQPLPETTVTATVSGLSAICDESECSVFEGTTDAMVITLPTPVLTANTNQTTSGPASNQYTSSATVDYWTTATYTFDNSTIAVPFPTGYTPPVTSPATPLMSSGETWTPWPSTVNASTRGTASAESSAAANATSSCFTAVSVTSQSLGAMSESYLACSVHTCSGTVCYNYFQTSRLPEVTTSSSSQISLTGTVNGTATYTSPSTTPSALPRITFVTGSSRTTVYTFTDSYPSGDSSVTSTFVETWTFPGLVSAQTINASTSFAPVATSSNTLGSSSFIFTNSTNTISPSSTPSPGSSSNISATVSRGSSSVSTAETGITLLPPYPATSITTNTSTTTANNVTIVLTSTSTMTVTNKPSETLSSASPASTSNETIWTDWAQWTTVATTNMPTTFTTKRLPPGQAQDAKMDKLQGMLAKRRFEQNGVDQTDNPNVSPSNGYNEPEYLQPSVSRLIKWILRVAR